MDCRKILPLLSEFLDETLEAGAAVEVSKHLDGCPGCRREYDALAAVHARLRALGRVPEPEYLGDLVRLRIADARRNRWSVQVREGLELHWSRIRTAGTLWYWSRAAGTLMTAVLFFLIPFSIDPPEIEAYSSLPERIMFTPRERSQLAASFQVKMGMAPGDLQREMSRSKRPATRPAINDQVLSDLGERISQDGDDYVFSVLTTVDRAGQAEAEVVIEHPNDRNFLDSFNKVMSASRLAPGRARDGETIDSRMLMIFSKISVYD